MVGVIFHHAYRSVSYLYMYTQQIMRGGKGNEEFSESLDCEN